MPLYRSPEERASETVTIRLTQQEKALLDYLAGLEGKTLTDLIRGLVARRAEELEVFEVPTAPRKRRPGRPKKKRPVEAVAENLISGSAPESDAEISAPSVPPPSVPPMADQTAHQRALISSNPVRHLLLRDADAEGPATTFYELLVRFHKSFAHRAEGTKKELEDTIEFLCFGGDTAIIPPDTPLSAITSERLKEIRQTIQNADIRFAKKNLHLTYLRMMLHFGVKERDVDFHVNPSGELEPLTITESNEGWRFFSGR